MLTIIKKKPQVSQFEPYMNTRPIVWYENGSDTFIGTASQIEVKKIDTSVTGIEITFLEMFRVRKARNVREIDTDSWTSIRGSRVKNRKLYFDNPIIEKNEPLICRCCGETLTFTHEGSHKVLFETLVTQT